MTTTTPTAETWADVAERLNTAASTDYAAVQKELEGAEVEHRRLTERALLGALGSVGPLDLQKVESRKQLAELHLRGLPEKHRRAMNEASRAHVAVVRAQADAFLSRHKGAENKVEAARKKIAAAVADAQKVVDEHNADVAVLLAEAGHAFTQTYRPEPIAEIQYYRDDVTNEVHERPVLKPPGATVVRAVTGAAEGVRVARWEGIINDAGGIPQALDVDGTVIEPLSLDRMVLAEVVDVLPKDLAGAGRTFLNSFGRSGR